MNTRILVVDDEADIVDLLAYTFVQAGCEVRTASDGPAGIREAMEWLPQAIILDLNLPYMDGIAVCEVLRRHEDTRHIPILMLTAWSSREAREIGLAVGADDYLLKPFSPQEIVRRTERLVSQRAVVSAA